MTSNSKEMPHLASTDRQLLGRLRNLGLELKGFFDVGASNGVWSHQVCEDFPGAIFDLFEPLVDFAPEYWQKLGPRLNQHPSFRLHKIALGAECKRIPFYLYPEPANSTTLEANAQESHRIEVDMFTLDYVIEEFRLDIPQVLKVDTQGSELNILRGARKTLPQIQVLLLECWLTRAYGPATPLFFEIAQWLRNFGFHLYDLGNGWRDTDGSLVAQDCVFLNQRSKVSRMSSESVAEGSSRRQRERLSERVRQFFLTASRRDQKDSKTF